MKLVSLTLLYNLKAMAILKELCLFSDLKMENYSDMKLVHPIFPKNSFFS